MNKVKSVKADFTLNLMPPVLHPMKYMAPMCLSLENALDPLRLWHSPFLKGATMSFSMRTASLPVFIHGLTNLSAVLHKAAAFAEEKKVDGAVLGQARLALDMFPLARQVQIACDIVKGGAARLAGVEVPSFEDNETTLPELQARIGKTIDFLKSIDPAKLDGSETRAIELKVAGNAMHFTGADYLLNFVLPNLFFHSTTAYGILRHNGVPVGKMDFLGAIQ